MNRYRFTCDNFKKAEENRERIKNKFAHAYWDELERTIRSTPFGVPLPSDVPIGNVPSVGKDVTREQVTHRIEADEENVEEV